MERYTRKVNNFTYIVDDLLLKKLSGVLVASLKQSMNKWRNGGCFEKYWVKNASKKAHQGFQNPPIQSMAKLGSAMLVIEPHSFEVILYSVKSVMPTPAALPPKSTSAFNTVIPPYRPPPQSPNTIQPLSTPKASQTTAPVKTELSSVSATKMPVSAPGTLQKLAPGSSAQKQATVSSSPATNVLKPAQQPSSSDPSSNNPVIQELALRASRDEKLKDLMRTVADGGASEVQLKEFQRHIDDINTMLRSKGIRETPLAKPKIGSAKKQGLADPRQKQPVWTQPITPNVKVDSQVLLQQAPISNSKSRPLISSNTGISAVVFEIALGTGDRYLIPKNSLLEFRDGHRLAVLSFLTHLKGSNANGGFYEDNKEYCELVTLKLFADRPEVLEPLRRAVDSPDFVRKQMQDWMGKMTVAEKAFLVLRARLSLESEESGPEQTMQTAKNDVLPLDYEAPNSLFPLHGSAVATKS